MKGSTLISLVLGIIFITFTVTHSSFVAVNAADAYREPIVATPAIGGPCAAFLTAPLKYGDQSLAVLKLQVFLIEQGEDIPAGGTGFYGAQTQAAVSSFQLRYFGQILLPLGLSAPTGSVYSATLAQINAIQCAQ